MARRRRAGSPDWRGGLGRATAARSGRSAARAADAAASRSEPLAAVDHYTASSASPCGDFIDHEPLTAIFDRLTDVRVRAGATPRRARGDRGHGRSPAAGRRDRHRRQRTGGLLELAFPDGTKIVVNTQPPLHELWLAARAGGFHFQHVGGRWLDTRRRQRVLRRAVGLRQRAGRAGAALRALRRARAAPASSAPEQVEDAVALFLARRRRRRLVEPERCSRRRRARTPRRTTRRSSVTTPSGGVRLLHRHALSAVFMKSIHTGSARPPPVSRSPSLRGLS